jgi:4-carboxymuconolactone decarboxylase
MIGPLGNLARLRLSAGALVLVLGTSATLGAQVRMAPIPADKMTDAQKKAAADFAAVRKTDPTGPFAVMLRVPELMDLTFKWREHVQFRSVLEPRLTELAIMFAARHWTQQYEWNAHYPLALKAGLKPEIIAAIEEGRRPSPMAEDEEILYDLCVEVQRNKGVSDATYARALARFGEPGIIEAVSLQGYYSLLAMVMNTARTPLPPGARPPLAAFPR